MTFEAIWRVEWAGFGGNEAPRDENEDHKNLGRREAVKTPLTRADIAGDFNRSQGGVQRRCSRSTA